MKRVTSPALTEKLCQLMIAFGELVIENTLPCWAKVAVPLTTWGTAGAAWAPPRKAAHSSGRSGRREKWLLVFIV